VVDILGGGTTLGGIIIIVVAVSVAMVTFLGKHKRAQISIRLRGSRTVCRAATEVVVDSALEGLAVGAVKRLNVVDFGVHRTGFHTRDAVDTVPHAALALDVGKVHRQRWTLSDKLVVFEVSDNARAVNGHTVGQRGKAEGQVIGLGREGPDRAVKEDSNVEEARPVEHTTYAGRQQKHFVDMRWYLVPLGLI